MNPLDALAFLQGTWNARAEGSNGAAADGFYSFQLELKNHVLARHSHTGNCKGPAEYDCDHSDLLYIYAEPAGQTLKAVYFDSEGHVIHYDVSIPAPDAAVFLSDRSDPGPQFQLTYRLKGANMAGRFETRMPGQGHWQPYLEWNGSRR